MKRNWMLLGGIAALMMVFCACGTTGQEAPAQDQPPAAAEPAEDKMQSLLEEAGRFSTRETDKEAIAKAGVEHYWATFTGEDVPEEARVSDVVVQSVEIIAEGDKRFGVQATTDYETKGSYFISANGAFEPYKELPEDGGKYTGDFRQFLFLELGDGNWQVIPMGTGGMISPDMKPAETEPRFLREFIDFDPEQVTEFEHTVVHQGPSVVEMVTSFTGQDARDMAAQAAELMVLDDETTADKREAGGSMIRYTLRFADGREPLVICYAGTFQVGSEDSEPLCYIDRGRYGVELPNVVDITFPEDRETVIYDIVDGRRVKR